MQLLIACDTSTPYLTLALCERDGKATPERVLGELCINAGRRHAETIFSSTQWLLEQSGRGMGEVSHLAVTIGPGSFTGLRIGVAAWKGLAYGLNLPLIGVPTLDALSRLHPWQDATVCTLLDARMSEVFCAAYCFQGGIRSKLRPDAVLPPEVAIEGLPPDTVFCGDGLLEYAAIVREHYPMAQLLPEAHSAPRGTAVASEAFALLDAGASTDAARVEPVYLRKTQAEYNREKSPVAQSP